MRSQGELDAANMTIGEIAKITLVRPFVLGFVEPIVFFWNIYIALVYGILYIFIESFRVVFVEKHHFNLGENGLAFLGLYVVFGGTYNFAATLTSAFEKMKWFHRYDFFRFCLQHY